MPGIQRKSQEKLVGYEEKLEKTIKNMGCMCTWLFFQHLSQWANLFTVPLSQGWAQRMVVVTEKEGTGNLM